MKIKEIMTTIESLNELRATLNIEKAYVQIWVDDIQLGDKDFTTMEALKKSLEDVYVEKFCTALLEADFTKTYNNTLSATLEFEDMFGYYSLKIDIFVDC